jgi:hypothetical protein
MKILSIFFLLFSVVVLTSTFLFVNANHNVLRKIAASANQKKNAIRGTPQGNLTLLADGFTWAENLFFSGDGGLFVADDMVAAIYRLTRETDAGPAKKETWLTGFKRALGMSNVFGQENQLYAVVELSSGSCVSFDGKSSNDHGAAIISFSTQVPNNFTIAVCSEVLGNGFAVNDQNGLGTIYTANEGGFIPSKGLVLQIEPSNEISILFDQNMDSADGVFLDQKTQLLYVSEVIQGLIRVYNVSQGQNTLLKQYHAPNSKMIDDFCIAYKLWDGQNSSIPFMFAADFWNETVMVFPADGSGPGRVLASGFYSPTSVRVGRGKGWNTPNSVYVTEGGGFIPSLQKNRRVWELHL